MQEAAAPAAMAAVGTEQVHRGQQPGGCDIMVGSPGQEQLQQQQQEAAACTPAPGQVLEPAVPGHMRSTVFSVLGIEKEQQQQQLQDASTR
eukprot:scaffold310455_cov19-Tisochrysis_lutea.AAC.2